MLALICKCHPSSDCGVPNCPHFLRGPEVGNEFCVGTSDASPPGQYPLALTQSNSQTEVFLRWISREVSLPQSRTKVSNCQFITH